MAVLRQIPIAVPDAVGYPEQAAALPWLFNPAKSWLDSQCWVEIELDPGMVLHKTLPQAADAVDDLGAFDFNDANWIKSGANGLAGGVNVRSGSTGQDTIQRMATSTFTFTLNGWAVRIGYPVTVPTLKRVGNQPCIPKEPQWSTGNIIIGSCGGTIPIYFCRWKLSYMVVGPIGANASAPTPPNLAAHVGPAAGTLPPSIRMPLSVPDPRGPTWPPPNPSGGGGSGGRGG